MPVNMRAMHWAHSTCNSLVFLTAHCSTGGRSTQCWCELGEDPKFERGSQSRVEGEGVSGIGREEGGFVRGVTRGLRRR